MSEIATLPEFVLPPAQEENVQESSMFKEYEERTKQRIENIIKTTALLAEVNNIQQP